jgi:hypothetical protein
LGLAVDTNQTPLFIWVRVRPNNPAAAINVSVAPHTRMSLVAAKRQALPTSAGTRLKVKWGH